MSSFPAAIEPAFPPAPDILMLPYIHLIVNHKYKIFQFFTKILPQSGILSLNPLTAVDFFVQ
jgi:hypothetical protein